MSAWYIKTRKEFFEVLDRTIDEAAKRFGEAPEFAPFGSVLQQLRAIKTWTADGRRATPEEQKRITIGILAVRELDQGLDAEMFDFHEALVQLDYYFRKWPDDAPGGP